MTYPERRVEHRPPMVAHRLMEAMAKKTGYNGTMTIEVFSPDREYLKLSLKKAKATWGKS